MSAIYFLGKFSNEALLIELFLIGLITTAYFGYLISKKRKYGVAKNMIPDHVVKAFLIELLSYSEGFKKQLFGENLQIDPSMVGKFQLQVATAPVAAAGASAGTADAGELHALKVQLGTSAQKIDELNKMIAGLQSQNATLQTQATEAAKSGGATAGGGDNKALLDKINALETKLSEYSVIEDDLANLKRYMQENKALKEKLSGMGGNPADVTAAATAAPTPAPVAAAATPAPAAAAPAPTPEPTPTPAPVAAAPTPAPAPEPAAAAPTPAPEPAKPSAPTGASVQDPQAPAAAPAASGGDKSDADLLNEFERMLNS